MSALRSSSCLLLFPSSPRLLVYSSPHFFVSGALGLGVTSHLQVRGADSDNLALTRVVQRDVWEWQFPPSCVNRRLLVVPWPEDQWHGMGSQVHMLPWHGVAGTHAAMAWGRRYTCCHGMGSQVHMLPWHGMAWHGMTCTSGATTDAHGQYTRQQCVPPSLAVAHAYAIECAEALRPTSP
ncbi:unnamed protein product [Closterium sp. NIES-54]